MTQNMFTIYSKTGCPYCDKIKRIMELAKFNHVTYTLGVDFTRDEFYAEFGQGSTFPQVIMDDRKLGGCSDAVKYLKENNMV